MTLAVSSLERPSLIELIGRERGVSMGMRRRHRKRPQRVAASGSGGVRRLVVRGKVFGRNEARIAKVRRGLHGTCMHPSRVRKTTRRLPHKLGAGKTSPPRELKRRRCPTNVDNVVSVKHQCARDPVFCKGWDRYQVASRWLPDRGSMTFLIPRTVPVGTVADSATRRGLPM